MSKSKRGAEKAHREVDEASSQESATGTPAAETAADETAEQETFEAVPMPKAVIAMVLAWLVPGGGHLLLGRLPRAVFFFAWVLLALALGCYFDGRLPWMLDGSPLQVLATLGAMGTGIPFFALRFGWGYEGDLSSPGYEYGSAFILGAGLMNMLVVLDSWDIAVGRKS